MKAKGLIRINSDGCKGCAFCVEFCPRKAIEISDQNNAAGYYPAIFNEEAGCTGCAQCAVMCPEVVIEVFRE